MTSFQAKGKGSLACWFCVKIMRLWRPVQTMREKTMAKTFRFLLPSVQLEDPHTCTDSHPVLTIRRLLFQGLVTYDGRTTEGLLAHTWECKDNGRAWTFYLRKGIRFSNGKELSARDVVYSLKRAASPEREGRLFTVTYHAYFGKAQIEAVDPFTVRFYNPEPLADLLEFLPDLSILPEGWKSYADGSGTGPFTIAAIEPGRLALRPREESGPQLEFREEKSPSLRAAAIIKGSADYALDPPQEIFDTSGSPFATSSHSSLERTSFITSTRDFDVYSWNTSLCVIFLIRSDLPPLDDPRVRRALNLLVDKERIIRKILRGRGRPLNGPLSDRHFGADSSLPPYPHDPAKAVELLREAGLTKGFNLNIHAPRTIPDEGPQLARFVAEDLSSAGIQTRIILHEDRTAYARKIAAKELDGIFCFDSSPLGTYKVLREKLDSRERGPWWQGYHNEDFNRLLSKAAETVDPTARREIYLKAYRILREDAPWIFLYSPLKAWIGRRGVMSGTSDYRVSFDSLGFLRV